MNGIEERPATMATECPVLDNFRDIIVRDKGIVKLRRKSLSFIGSNRMMVTKGRILGLAGTQCPRLKSSVLY